MWSGVLPGKSTTLMYASTVQQTILGRIPARARTELQKAAFTEYQAKEKAQLVGWNRIHH